MHIWMDVVYFLLSIREWKSHIFKSFMLVYEGYIFSYVILILLSSSFIVCYITLFELNQNNKICDGH